jgi:hypothetical protein
LTAKIQEISTLGILEWVQVKSTLLATKNPTYSCSSCLSKYNYRSDSEMMTAKERGIKACEEVRKEPFFNIDRQIYFKTCPGNFVTQSVLHWMGVHESFRKGIMPYAGGFLDQPNKALDLFKMFDAFYAEQALERMKKQAASKGKRRG